MAEQTYGAEYFASYGRNRVPYRRGDFGWETFFGGVADELVRLTDARTFLDAGCAVGFLVEALRDRGVEAYGVDTSEYAIGQAPAGVREYLRVASVAEELDRSFDAISCIEVLEHVPADVAAAAIANFARHTDVVLFSSSPDATEDPTHVNVRSIGDWIRLFAEHGLYPDPTVDATFLAKHALLFRRADATSVVVAADAALRHERARAKALEKRVRKLEQRPGLGVRLLHVVRRLRA
jgi:2-polyprenyl-3-methyl-5-hydroxy-6-metoxy-1,4-benzoquinol methylase